MPDLSRLPDLPALQQLARALWHNGSVRGAALMVGAGFSKNATLQSPDTQEAPSWNELLIELLAQLYPTDPSSAPTDALRIAEEFRTYFGQATLDGFIRTRFHDRSWLPGPLHLQTLGLPWSDILTTNWDTLLERTADEVTDIIYEVVRTEADIAQARAPRIIKLHGTLGDKDPLIFAAEDYRTYPARHAAFVNLARQIFIENDLCLLGFSGDDPNFLEWAGWVRDQLGGHARRIYLAGYLRLSPPKRKYLEANNIAPIDLASLVEHLPAKERYRAATKLLLDGLFAEQPPAPHEWKRHAFSDLPLAKEGPDAYKRLLNDDAFAVDVLRGTAQLLREDRANYPGWLVCPRQERRKLDGYGEWAIFKSSVLTRIEPTERAKILSEFLWRHTTNFQDISPAFRDALIKIMQEESPHIDQELRLQFSIALMRDARIEDDDANLEKWGAIVDAEAKMDAPERLEAQYQRCLHMRDRLDLAKLVKALSSLDSENPLWRLRQAGLYTEVGEYVKAIKLIKDATADLEKAYRTDRNSIWIKSCLAWASWLNRAAAVGDFRRAEDLPQPREFRHLKIDPGAELEALENAANEIRIQEREDDAAVIPLFDAGAYRQGKVRAHARSGDTGLAYLYELDQVIERCGVPMRINHVAIASEAAMSVVRVAYHHSARWHIWLVRGLHSHFDNPFARYFGRIAVAQLPQDLANHLRLRLDAAIQFWRMKFSQSSGEALAKDRSIALNELRLALSIQSHMTVRMTVDEAVRAFGVGCEIAQDPISHQWIIEAAGDLAKYAIEAIPRERQASMIIDAMRFPLASERGGFAPGWPDFVALISNVKPERDFQDPRWDQRVKELLIAAAPSATGRVEATERLAYLASHDVLKPEERDIFGKVLWRKVDSGTPPLPADTHLLTSIIIKLPAPIDIDPIDRVKARIFGRDVKEAMECESPLDTRVLSEKRNYLIALYNVGPLGIPMPSQRASEIFDQIVNWRPNIRPDDDPMTASFKQNFVDFVKQQASDALTFAVLPAMAKEDRNSARLAALLAHINENQAWRAVGALPDFLETVPEMQVAIERAIHLGLSATMHLRVSGAATALLRWSRLVEMKVLKLIPSTLIERLLSMIEARQEGLHVLLHTVVALVKDGALLDSDVSRLVYSLSELREETSYANIVLDSRRAITNSLVRQQCVRLAQALMKRGVSDGIVEGWLSEGRSDSLPEVRFATLAE